MFPVVLVNLGEVQLSMSFYFSFQDRGKRLRLQEFIVKNASLLFDESFTAPPPETRSKITVDETYYAALPPYETFCNADKESKIKRFFEVDILLLLFKL